MRAAQGPQTKSGRRICVSDRTIKEALIAVVPPQFAEMLLERAGAQGARAIYRVRGRDWPEW